MTKILFVLTSAEQGWYLPEAAHPYYVFAGHQIDFVSPAGPNPPLAADSVEAYKEDAECVQFLKDEVVQAKLAGAKKLADVSAADYDLVFYVGGYGPVYDLAKDATNAKLASAFFQAGKITAAVCHGPAALVGATDAAGKSVFEGRAFTGFSNAEEEILNKTKEMPFLLEDKLAALGGKYEKATEPFGVHVVVDGNLYTGQNPASARALAEVVLKALK